MKVLKDGCQDPPTKPKGRPKKNSIPSFSEIIAAQNGNNKSVGSSSDYSSRLKNSLSDTDSSIANSIDDEDDDDNEDDDDDENDFSSTDIEEDTDEEDIVDKKYSNIHVKKTNDSNLQTWSAEAINKTDFSENKNTA